MPTPTLHTARLLLRPFTQGDTDTTFAPHSSLRMLRYWDAPPWSERAQAERFIAVCKQMEEEGSGVRLAIERAVDRPLRLLTPLPVLIRNDEGESDGQA